MIFLYFPGPPCVDGYKKYEKSNVFGSYSGHILDTVEECKALCKSPGESDLCAGLDFK